MAQSARQASSTVDTVSMDGVAYCAALAQRVLGQPVTALAVGIAAPKRVGKWAKGEGIKEQLVERRLLALARIIKLLATRYGDDNDMIRTWVLSPNPLLDERAVVEVLATDVQAEWTRAVQAAKAFVS